MVFCGRPSKACERCRTRRLRCDIKRGGCSQCFRANMQCSGYRDAQHLRIRNETKSVMRRVSRNALPLEPQSLPLAIDFQARNVFFAYYVTGNSECWSFLKQYYHPTDSPDHLTMAIEAVSLAYLWHRTYSDAALITATERYVLALRNMTKALEFSQGAIHDTSSLLASLLLDLFEKITDSKPRSSKSWTSHIDGALALVRARGFEQFRDPSEFRVLLRFSMNYITSCMISGSAVPDEIIAIRTYVGKRLNAQDYTCRMLEPIIRYTSLRNDIQRNVLSNDDLIRISVELDTEIQALELCMPSSWQYSTTVLEHKSDRKFDLHFDSYPHRNICQALNILRFIRILLNESLVEYYTASPMDGKPVALIRTAQKNVERLAGEICASVPQYVDCDHAARQRLLPSEKSETHDKRLDDVSDHDNKRACHLHTPNHQADVYSLIFPLYAAGRAKTLPEIRIWAIEQLHYMGSHFHLRNAEEVAQILERGAEVRPWEVYALLGSYAFTA